MAQCEKMAKGTRLRCKRQAIAGKTACKLHGGLSLGGPASPRYKHGRYSKFLPVRLMARYEEAREDPTLLSLTDDIALIDSRIAELLEGLESGGIGAVWNRLQAGQAQFLAAQAKGNTAGIGQAWNVISKAIQDGATEQERWIALSSAIGTRQRLVESERKRIMEMGQIVTLKELTGLFTTLIDVLRENISDPKTLNGVLNALNQNVFDRPDQRMGAGERSQLRLIESQFSETQGHGNERSGMGYESEED